MKVFDKFINKEIKNQISKKSYFNNAIFLDRDGVIIKDCHYIKNPLDVQLENNIIELINLAKKYNWLVIVITNQSGISRGILSWTDYQKVNKRMIDLFGESNPFAGIYANSLLENTSKNSWRKPSPKMILEAANDLRVNLKESIIVGDRISDMEAGARAGLCRGIHVLTGHGKDERPKLKRLINKDSFFINNREYIMKIDLIKTLKDFPKDLIS